MHSWSAGLVFGAWNLDFEASVRRGHHIAQHPSLSYCCEPRRSFIFLMARQMTEPSIAPTFPPVAPRSLEEAPLALSFLKSPPPWMAPPRACGTIEPPYPGDQSFKSVSKGDVGPRLVLVSVSFCGETQSSPPAGSRGQGVLACPPR